MNRLAFFFTGFGVGLLTAIVLEHSEPEGGVLRDVALRPFMAKDVIGTVTLIDSDGNRRSLSGGDTIVLPVWKHGR